MIQWQKGEWIETNLIDARHEVVTGQGVFETVLVSDQVPQFLNLHLDRLNNSCQILGLGTPALPVIREGIERLLDGRITDRGRLRITLFGGFPWLMLIRGPRAHG